MSSSILSVFISVLHTAVEVYLSLLFIRFLLQLMRVDFYNPIARIINNITYWPVRTMQFVVPSHVRANPAVLLLMFLIQIAELALIGFLGDSQTLVLSRLALLSLAILLRIMSNIIFYLILGAVIISWIAPTHRHPLVILIRQITEPMFHAVRRIVPPTAGIDWSPVVIMILLYIVQRIVFF